MPILSWMILPACRFGLAAALAAGYLLRLGLPPAGVAVETLVRTGITKGLPGMLVRVDSAVIRSRGRNTVILPRGRPPPAAGWGTRPHSRI